MAGRAKRLKTEALPFDEEEYAELRRHYMEPVTLNDADLATTRRERLRSQTRTARFEQNGPGWKQLRKRIKTLQKAHAHQEIHRILRELRQWEIRPPGLGGTMPGSLSCGPSTRSEVTELIDVSGNDAEVVDVDTYILDLLLVKEVKPDPEGSSSHTVAVKHETDAQAAADDALGAARDEQEESLGSEELAEEDEEEEDDLFELVIKEKPSQLEHVLRRELEPRDRSTRMYVLGILFERVCTTSRLPSAARRIESLRTLMAIARDHLRGHQFEHDCAMVRYELRGDRHETSIIPTLEAAAKRGDKETLDFVLKCIGPNERAEYGMREALSDTTNAAPTGACRDALAAFTHGAHRGYGLE